MEKNGWPSDWLRGALGVCVLSTLTSGPTYGYAISRALETSGLGTVKGGTLYPLLARLEEAGFVDVEWRAGDGGPGRKFYTLTAAGHAEAARRAAEWRSFTDVTLMHLGDVAHSTDRTEIPGELR